MKFKTIITDVNALGVAIDKVNAIIRANTSSEIINGSLFGSALDGLSAKQVALALSTKQLSDEQLREIIEKNELIKKYGAEELIKIGLISANSSLLASEKAVDAELVESDLLNAGLNEKLVERLALRHLSIVADGEETASKQVLVKAMMDEAVQRGYISAEKAQGILSTYGVVTADKAEKASKEALTAAIRRQIKAQLALTTSNPMTWIAVSAAAIYLAVKAVEYFNDSLEDVEERISSNQEVLSEYTSKVDELTSKLEELNATDVTYFSDAEKQELETEKEYIQSEIDLYNQLIEAKQKAINQDSIKATMGQNEKVAIKKLWSELTSGDWEGLDNTQKEIFGKSNPLDYLLTGGISSFLKNVDDGNYISEAYKLFEKYQQLQNKYIALENLAIKSGNSEILVEKTEETSSKMTQVAADIATYIEQISAARDQLANSENSDDYIEEIAKMDEAIEKYQTALTGNIYESKYTGYTDLQRDLLGVRDVLDVIAKSEGLENSDIFNGITNSINHLIDVIDVLNTYSLPEIFQIHNIFLTNELNNLNEAFSNLKTSLMNGELFDKIKNKLGDVVPSELIEKWESLKTPIDEVVTKLEELISYIGDGTGITNILNTLETGITNMIAPLLIFIDKYHEIFGDAKEAWDEAHNIEYSENSQDDSSNKDDAQEQEKDTKTFKTFAEAFNAADFADTKEELLELAKSGKLTPETLSSTEEYNKLLMETGTSAESAANQILDMLSGQEKLSALSQGLDSLKTAYEEFKDEDIGFVTAETLQSLPDVFKNLPSFDLFSQIVGDPTSGTEAIQQAFNDITKEYLLSQDTLQGLIDASEHNIQSYIANMKQMGITNAEEVVTNIKNAQIELKNAGIDLNNVTNEEAEAFINEAESSDIAIQYLRMYIEDFYKKFWDEPTGKPYESMMNKPRVKKDDKSSKEKIETEVIEETK